MAPEKAVNFTALVLADLVRDEGEVLHAYPDSLGFLTIGVGRLIDQRRGGGISHGEAMMLLRNDVDRVTAKLDRALPWWIGHSDVRRRVLINMAFNLGVGSANPPKGLLAFRNTLAAIKARDYEAAAQGMLASRWAAQVGDRAKRLAEMMRRG